MIRIGKFAITAYDRGYIVGKPITVKNKETGEITERIDKPAYLSTMQQCLKKIRAQMHLETIERYEGDLAGAISALDKADAKYEKMVEGVERH